MKKNKLKSLIKFILIIGISLYIISILISQQKDLNSYAKEQEYITEQIQEKQEEKEELAKIKENVNSPEYIEEVAREKLNMYLPNERVYVDVNK